MDDEKVLDRVLDSIKDIDNKITNINKDISNLTVEVEKIKTKLSVAWATGGILVVIATVGTFVFTLVKGC